jgi:RNA polymerase sigma-70 factor, ECF subfamily
MPVEAAPAQPLAHDETPALVKAAQSGDRAAFARLYQRYGPVVHGVLLARVGRNDAEDLVQEVFLAAWRRLGSLRDPRAVGAWLCATARHAAATSRRGPARPASLTGDPAGGHTTDASEEGAAALAAIRALPEAYRETLVLRLVEGLTGPQIAAAMGMTEGSVRVNLHRGMVLLKERLASRLEVGP